MTKIEDNNKDSKQDNEWENDYSAKLLGLAVREAQTIGDSRAQSYALGYLGELYEKSQQLSDARKLTEKALILAQTTNANDIAYRWQWQLGRLLKKQNRIDEAIKAYSQSVKTLDLIRNDLVANTVDVQFIENWLVYCFNLNLQKTRNLPNRKGK